MLEEVKPGRDASTHLVRFKSAIEETVDSAVEEAVEDALRNHVNQYDHD
jgi:hypothetical protein